MIKWLKQKKEEGVKLILWTCRVGDLLEQAITYCNAYGLEFDAINENIPEMVDRYGSDSRKVFAHLYIDDCCRTPWEILEYKPKDKPKIPLRKAKITR